MTRHQTRPQEARQWPSPVVIVQVVWGAAEPAPVEDDPPKDGHRGKGETARDVCLELESTATSGLMVDGVFLGGGVAKTVHPTFRGKSGLLATSQHEINLYPGRRTCDCIARAS